MSVGGLLIQEMKIRYYHKPIFKESEKRNFISKLRKVAKTCFDELPVYQILDYDFDTSKSIITTAEDKGQIVGFCASLELQDGTNKPFLHMGLTCVRPDYRNKRLTHKLAGKLTMKYLLKTNPLGKIRFTNIACVLSSLGNVAKNFENVFPSPGSSIPGKDALRLASAISQKYRNWVHIPEKSHFDYETFTFKASALDMFHKASGDTKYYHRIPKYNNYYKTIMDMDAGDEVLQTGHFSLWTFIKYLIK
jgi:hypothetical protein